MTRHVSLVVAAIASVVLVATFTNAQNSKAIEKAANPFDGKTVIFESTSAFLTYSPKQGVRLKTVAGREFFAWEQKREGEENHDYWIPADSVTKIRIFEKLEDADAFAQRHDPRSADGTKR